MHVAFVVLHGDVFAFALGEGDEAVAAVGVGGDGDVHRGDVVVIDGVYGGAEVDCAAAVGGDGGEDGGVVGRVETVVEDLEGGAFGCVDVEILDGSKGVAEVEPGVGRELVVERFAKVDGEGGGGAGRGVGLWSRCCEHRGREEGEDGNYGLHGGGNV